MHPLHPAMQYEMARQRRSAPARRTERPGWSLPQLPRERMGWFLVGLGLRLAWRPGPIPAAR
jgi:hypothetical protein